MFDPPSTKICFHLAHISSNDVISEYSRRRLFSKDQESKFLKDFVNFVCTNACPQALTSADFKQLTKKEKILHKLKYLILENRWLEIQKELIKSEHGINSNELKKVSKTKYFLAMNDPILREN